MLVIRGPYITSLSTHSLCPELGDRSSVELIDFLSESERAVFLAEGHADIWTQNGAIGCGCLTFGLRGRIQVTLNNKTKHFIEKNHWNINLKKDLTVISSYILSGVIYLYHKS